MSNLNLEKEIAALKKAKEDLIAVGFMSMVGGIEEQIKALEEQNALLSSGQITQDQVSNTSVQIKGDSVTVTQTSTSGNNYFSF